MSAQPPNQPAFVPRGVWKGYHKRDGQEVVQAIDAHGRCLGEIVLHAGVDRAWVRQVLEQLLEQVDPVQQPLELVR